MVLNFINVYPAEMTLALNEFRNLLARARIPGTNKAVYFGKYIQGWEDMATTVGQDERRYFCLQNQTQFLVYFKNVFYNYFILNNPKPTSKLQGADNAYYTCFIRIAHIIQQCLGDTEQIKEQIKTYTDNIIKKSMFDKYYP